MKKKSELACKLLEDSSLTIVCFVSLLFVCLFVEMLGSKSRAMCMLGNLYYLATSSVFQFAFQSSLSGSSIHASALVKTSWSSSVRHRLVMADKGKSKLSWCLSYIQVQPDWHVTPVALQHRTMALSPSNDNCFEILKNSRFSFHHSLPYSI